MPYFWDQVSKFKQPAYQIQSAGFSSSNTLIVEFDLKNGRKYTLITDSSTSAGKINILEDNNDAPFLTIESSFPDQVANDLVSAKTQTTDPNKKPLLRSANVNTNGSTKTLLKYQFYSKQFNKLCQGGTLNQQVLSNLQFEVNPNLQVEIGKELTKDQRVALGLPKQFIKNLKDIRDSALVDTNKNGAPSMDNQELKHGKQKQ